MIDFMSEKEEEKFCFYGDGVIKFHVFNYKNTIFKELKRAYN